MEKRKKLTPLGLLATIIYTIFILTMVLWFGLHPVSFLGLGPLPIFIIIFVVSMVLFIALLKSSDKLLREK
jgi:hypothetical protein